MTVDLKERLALAWDIIARPSTPVPVVHVEDRPDNMVRFAYGSYIDEETWEASDTSDYPPFLRNIFDLYAYHDGYRIVVYDMEMTRLGHVDLGLSGLLAGATNRSMRAFIKPLLEEVVVWGCRYSHRWKA